MYLTYTEYQAYGGQLDEATFSDLEFEASGIINWYTFRRLVNDETVDEAVKRCVYHLIKELDMRNKAMTLGKETTTSSEESTTTSGVIQSQSNDGFSVSYNVVVWDLRVRSAWATKLG